jgi:hypothetical protein
MTVAQSDSHPTRAQAAFASSGRDQAADFPKTGETIVPRRRTGEDSVKYPG